MRGKGGGEAMGVERQTTLIHFNFNDIKTTSHHMLVQLLYVMKVTFIHISDRFIITGLGCGYFYFTLYITKVIFMNM